MAPSYHCKRLCHHKNSLWKKTTPTFIHACCGRQSQASRSPVWQHGSPCREQCYNTALIWRADPFRTASKRMVQSQRKALQKTKLYRSFVLNVCAHPGPSSFGWSKALAWLISNCSRIVLTYNSWGLNNHQVSVPRLTGITLTLPFKVRFLDEKGCCFLFKHWNYYTKPFTSKMLQYKRDNKLS